MAPNSQTSEATETQEGWFPGVPELSTVTSLKPFGTRIDLDQTRKEAKKFYESLPKTSLEDADLLVPDLIKKYGYPSEEHIVTTEDGYILTLHRISHGRETTQNNRTPILLVHGLISSSADWILTGPRNGLGYIMADAGYDVWLANCRGNRYSRSHTTMTPESFSFWDFSFHEIAIYDLPAIIDHILEQTKQTQVYYVGHSQGTTVSYVLCAQKPEYNAKIAAIISLAPIGFMNNMTSPIMRLISDMEGGIELIATIFGEMEFLPHSNLLSRAAEFLALDGSPTQILLTNSLFLVCGFSPSQINTETLPILMGQTPAGISTKQLLHYGQEYKSGRFCQWDGGFISNNFKFGSENPPDYKLGNITCPVYLFYSQNDWISHEYDVGRLYLGLTGTKNKEAILVGKGRFNHLDYMYGLDAPREIYSVILEKLRHYTKL